MRPSRANKVDSNQAAIVDALEKTGATVQMLGAVGNGCPDILVGRLGVNVLMEIKNPDGKNRVGEKQAEWIANWRGQCVIVRDEYEAMRVILELSTGHAATQAREGKLS
jgi:hypothetical protein